KRILEGDFLTKIYQDADLTLQNHPAEIGSEMISKVSANLQKINWSDAVVGEFLGTYLSEPKAHVVFDKNKKITLRQFSEKIAKSGIALDLKSQMLFFSKHFYINGDSVDFTGESANILKILADKRRLCAISIQDQALLEQLFDWYIAGYLNFD
ncbi:MAG: winged helix domain-containing protein, partial [Methylotenera sp.]